MTREEAINEWIVPAIKNTWNRDKCKEILEALEREYEEEDIIDKINKDPSMIEERW